MNYFKSIKICIIYTVVQKFRILSEFQRLIAFFTYYRRTTSTLTVSKFSIDQLYNNLRVQSLLFTTYSIHSRWWAPLKSFSNYINTSSCETFSCCKVQTNHGTNQFKYAENFHFTYHNLHLGTVTESQTRLLYILPKIIVIATKDPRK